MLKGVIEKNKNLFTYPIRYIDYLIYKEQYIDLLIIIISFLLFLYIIYYFFIKFKLITILKKTIYKIIFTPLHI